MLTFLCLGLLLGTGSPAAPVADSPGSVSWGTHYSDGLEEARKTNRPVLLVFWADWCAPCRLMEQEVLYDEDVAPLLKKFVCLHIDIDRDTWTAGLYHVNGIPRVLILDPSGTVLSDLVGYRKKQELMPLLSAVPGDFSPVAAVIARLKEDSDDFPAWMGMAEFYAKLGASDASTKYLKDALKTTEGKGHNRSRENALNKLGLQSLKMKRAKDARKAFQQCLAEFGADGSQCDFAMLGLITALASERKFDEAEKLLAELRGRFPDSPVVDRAVKNIEEARAAR